jgi:hypothetical protein
MNWKIVVGTLLMLPSAAAWFWCLWFQFDNPAMTQTQLFLEIGYVPLLALIPGFAGYGIFLSGLQDSEDPED